MWEITCQKVNSEMLVYWNAWSCLEGDGCMWGFGFIKARTLPPRLVDNKIPICPCRPMSWASVSPGWYHTRCPSWFQMMWIGLFSQHFWSFMRRCCCLWTSSFTTHSRYVIVRLSCFPLVSIQLGFHWIGTSFVPVCFMIRRFFVNSVGLHFHCPHQ